MSDEDVKALDWKSKGVTWTPDDGSPTVMWGSCPRYMAEIQVGLQDFVEGFEHWHLFVTPLVGKEVYFSHYSLDVLLLKLWNEF